MEIIALEGPVLQHGLSSSKSRTRSHGERLSWLLKSLIPRHLLHIQGVQRHQQVKTLCRRGYNVAVLARKLMSSVDKER